MPVFTYIVGTLPKLPHSSIDACSLNPDLCWNIHNRLISYSKGTHSIRDPHRARSYRDLVTCSKESPGHRIQLQRIAASHAAYCEDPACTSGIEVRVQQRGNEDLHRRQSQPGANKRRRSSRDDWLHQTERSAAGERHRQKGEIHRRGIHRSKGDRDEDLHQTNHNIARKDLGTTQQRAQQSRKKDLHQKQEEPRVRDLHRSSKREDHQDLHQDLPKRGEETKANYLHRSPEKQTDHKEKTKAENLLNQIRATRGELAKHKQAKKEDRRYGEGATWGEIADHKGRTKVEVFRSEGGVTRRKLADNKKKNTDREPRKQRRNYLGRARNPQNKTKGRRPLERKRSHLGKTCRKPQAQKRSYLGRDRRTQRRSRRPQVQKRNHLGRNRRTKSRSEDTSHPRKAR